MHYVMQMACPSNEGYSHSMLGTLHGHSQHSTPRHGEATHMSMQFDLRQNTSHITAHHSTARQSMAQLWTAW